MIGVGLNLSIPDDGFPDDLRWPATSLGHGVGAAEALEALREALGRWTAADPGEVLEAFATRDALSGRDVGWVAAGGATASGSGRAEGVDARGNLVVVTHSGERVSLGAGEVSLSL